MGKICLKRGLWLVVYRGIQLGALLPLDSHPASWQPLISCAWLAEATLGGYRGLANWGLAWSDFGMIPPMYENIVGVSFHHSV